MGLGKPDTSAIDAATAESDKAKEEMKKKEEEEILKAQQERVAFARTRGGGSAIGSTFKKSLLGG